MIRARLFLQIVGAITFLAIGLEVDALPARPRAETSGLTATPTPINRAAATVTTPATIQPAPPQVAARSATHMAPAAVVPRSVAQPAPPAAAPVSDSGEPRPSTTVVIDAGHGGFDRGGIAGQRVPEKNMNLDVALRLQRILQANGYRVVMTRSTDVFLPLGTRVAIANSYRNAIFVCIHFNSASRSGASGIETYFFSSQSLALASSIHYYVSGFAPSSNRGVRRRGFYVLRRTTIPSVLVECGFLTNPTEAQYAQSASYRQNLAESIARGIRTRGSVSRSASAGAVPLQPFIDQTRVSSRSSKSKRSHKSSSKKKSSKKKSSSSSSSSKKKKSSSSKSEE